jgi:sporulation protein YlmC with PRC-barrel domain
MKNNPRIYIYSILVLACSAGFSAPAQTLIHGERAINIYGKQVLTSDNQKAGNLNNLILDLESGRILYATVAASKGRVGVPAQIFTRTPSAGDNYVHASVTKQKIDDAPQFTGDIDKPEDIGKADFVSRVYQHFGQQPWWQGSQPVNVGSFNNVHKASELVGKDVQDVNNKKIAKVSNVIVDLLAGRVLYVVLAPDSSLNLGNNLYALPPQAVTLSRDHKNLVTGVDQTKLASAPHFDRNTSPNLSDQNLASQIYQYYGKQAYFNTGNVAPTGR